MLLHIVLAKLLVLPNQVLRIKYPRYFYFSQVVKYILEF